MELRTDKKLLWPAEIQDVKYLSKADNTLQSMYFYSPQACDPVPLMVYLHPWSADYRRDDGSVYAHWCVENNWAIIIPDFRGPNIRPEACASELVVADINSAVDYALENAPIDPQRIFPGGVSGGGHITLLMTGRNQERWAGASAWVPVFDLASWHEYCSNRPTGYTAQMETVCGGKPGDSPEVNHEYQVRSASHWLNNSINIPIELVSGMRDEVIPPSHTLEAFNALVTPEERFSREEINFIVEKRQIPAHLKSTVKQRAVFGDSKILYERETANVKLLIVDCEHEILSEVMLDCFKNMNDKIISGSSQKSVPTD